MIKTLDSKKKNFDKLLDKLLFNRKNKIKLNSVIVLKIIKDVKRDGDKSLLKYERKFSKNNSIVVKKKNIEKNIKTLNPKVKKSIDLAYSRIFKFHSKQKFKNIFYKDYLKNKLYYKYISIDSVGIYVPGGTASYPSTVLMNAIPAIIARVKRIVMVSPKNKGKLNPGVLYAAKKCGIREIYSIGGAQAIAALTYGTKTISKVNKIIGPGNLYVATAKKEIFGDVGIDMIAGPSEITVVGDKSSNPDWIAADLIAQAEHDELSQSIFISKEKKLIANVKDSLIKQLKVLPRRFIASKSLKNNGIFIFNRSEKELIKIINKIAPEHLELNIKNYKKIVNKINNAGSIFIGKYSTEAVGDYLAGTNHVLPTSGSAKFSSGLSVYDFYKRISYINLSKKGIETLGPSVITLANFEGLEGHAKSIELRIRRK
ncbi:MAG: histidinol dehydrogenase [Pelagibacterales bacterium]|nr:histidinol dehydrogenase [Pelagibacterales bacterium]